MKINIRPWNETDARELAALADSRKVWDFVRDYFPHPYTIEDAKEYLALATGKENTEDFAITADGILAGGAGFIPQQDVHRPSAEIGYWLGEQFQGRGIMTVAIGLLTEYIFRNTGHTHLFANVFGFNRASMRVLEKNGFTAAGIMHKCVVKNGRITDLHFYEKLK